MDKKRIVQPVTNNSAALFAAPASLLTWQEYIPDPRVPTEKSSREEEYSSSLITDDGPVMSSTSSLNHFTSNGGVPSKTPLKSTEDFEITA